MFTAPNPIKTTPAPVLSGYSQNRQAQPQGQSQIYNAQPAQRPTVDLSQLYEHYGSWALPLLFAKANMSGIRAGVLDTPPGWTGPPTPSGMYRSGKPFGNRNYPPSSENYAEYLSPEQIYKLLKNNWNIENTFNLLGNVVKAHLPAPGVSNIGGKGYNPAPMRPQPTPMNFRYPREPQTPAAANYRYPQAINQRPAPIRWGQILNSWRR